MNKTLADIAAAIGAQLHGDGALPVSGVATLENASAEQISFFSHSRYRKVLRRTSAVAVILRAGDLAQCPTAALVTPNPELAYAGAVALFSRQLSAPSATGIHPSAWVSDSSQIAADAWIGPQCVVEDGAVIESGAFIGAGCVIAKNATIGAGSRLVANVTICHGVRIGRRVLIHPGAVVGSDGFGLANDKGRWVKIEQIGSVCVADDVEIGANTTIDRGALEDTVIGEGVKLDNQIQIAHNVRIGAHTAIAGCVGIAGSSHIGCFCQIGGGVGIAGHLEIGDRVIITGMSLVTKSIPQAGVYSSGLPVQPNRLWNKISARLRHIDELARKIAALEKASER